MASSKQLSNLEISSFCSQMTMLLRAGIAPAEGVRILLSDTTDSDGKAIFQSILDVCMQGESFSKAITAAGVFPDYVRNTISLGEQSGNLDVVMQSLADYYEKEETVSSSIKTAIRYPLMMIAMMVVVILVMITKVLPIFQQVFHQLGGEINSFSAGLLQLGTTLNRYSVLFLMILIILSAFYFLLAHTRRGRVLLTGFLLRFPLTAGFYDKVAAGRFANGMALSLSSGLDTYASLELVDQMVGNEKMSAKIKDCKRFIESGDNFSEALVKAGIFSNLYSRMVSVSYKSGSIDVAMKKIAEDYERETDQKLRSIISTLEPTLVIILSLIVGFILLSVILPLIGIMSSIG